jgi:hypothetical protein
MRSLGTATVLLALLFTGCGSGDGDADDVPTITTRPSTPATSASTDPTSEPTSAPSSVVTTEPPSESSAPTSPATKSEPPLTETAGPSPEPPTDDPVGPVTYREAVARIDQVSGTAPAPIVTTRFSTRDDVVYCLLDDDVVGPSCELRLGFIKDAEVCGGAAEGVGRIETFEGRARPVCNSDTIREPGAREVTADAIVVLTGGGVECAVERAGVTCVDSGNRTGFFLGPGEYHVF